MISVEVSVSMDPLHLKDLRQFDVAKIDKYVSTTQEKLDKYVRFSDPSNEVVDQVLGIVELADKWCANVNSLYNETEAYSWGRSKEGTNEVKVFSGGPEQTV